MGLLDGFVGGVAGAGLVSVVNDILEKHGGLQGVVNQFETKGLGPTESTDLARRSAPRARAGAAATAFRQIRDVGAGPDAEALSGAAANR